MFGEPFIEARPSAVSSTIIVKNPEAGHASPNLPDYEEASAHFSWETAAGCLDGMPDGAPGELA
jgi:hypothetical protein